MTLQIALVGTDGIVLASDKLSVVYDPAKHGSLTSKILIDPTQGIGITYAGYEVSETVAKGILSDPSPVKEKWRKVPFESFAVNICKRDEFRPYGWRGELIIVSLDDLSHVLHLSMKEHTKEPVARLNRVEDKILAGDSLNSAGFFVESYYSKQPVARLVFLAAHVVLTGSRLNPGGINGLEIVKCTSQGFEHLSEPSVAELIERSDELDLQIRSNLFAL